MIKTKKSGAKYSSIVGIGEELRKKMADEKREYLLLNRGVNAVENIDIQNIAGTIDFNSNDIQVYPHSNGRMNLRKAINTFYFFEKASLDHIFITNGGVGALDLIFKTLDIDEVVLPSLYWGAYLNILKINKIHSSFYSDIDFLYHNLKRLKGKAVLICDPNNPSGIKLEDEKLLEIVQKLDKEGIVVLFDSPYRRLYTKWETDDFYRKLADYENVIIAESFSKSIGLSGQRIGFVYCKNEEFMQELSVNLIFATNGINNFSQILVEKILSEPGGIKIAAKFRFNTVAEIQKNIAYLIKRNLLANEFYGKTIPWGIFVIVNKSFDQLLQYQIGSVPFGYFTKSGTIVAENFARICVSVPHLKLVEFFDRIIT